MAFKIPEQYRVDEKKARAMAFINPAMRDLISDVTSGPNGYFYLPRMNKKEGSYYLIRSVKADGWYCVAVNIPTEGRCPTVEEMHWVRGYFFDKEDVTFIMQHKEPYLAGQKFWVHIWYPTDVLRMPVPPIFEATRFGKVPFFKRLYKEIVRRLKYGNSELQEKKTSSNL